MIICGVVKSIRTNACVDGNYIVRESVVEVVRDVDGIPLTHYINSLEGVELNQLVWVRVAWVALKDELGYWSAHPIDLAVFGNSAEVQAWDESIF
jgi:hypothetical protein